MAYQVFGLVWLALMLSGDAAVVVALACRALPSWRERIRGAFAGAGVTILTRLVLSGGLIATHWFPPGMIYVQLIAAALLMGIAIRLLTDAPGTLPAAVRMSAIAVLLLQLVQADNLVAMAAAARDSLTVDVLALIVTIPIVAIAVLVAIALLVSRLFQALAALALGLLIVANFVLVRVVEVPLLVLEALLLLELLGFPILAWVFAAQFGWLAGTLVVDEPWLGRRLVSAGVASWMPAAAGAFAVVLFGWLACRRRLSAPVAPSRVEG